MNQPICKELHWSFPPISATVLRLYKAERWRVGTIARQLHAIATRAPRARPRPASRHRRRRRALPRRSVSSVHRADAAAVSHADRRWLFRHGARAWLPRQPEHFRHIIAGMRPRPPAEAFLRLRALPAEQAQIHWGHLGHLQGSAAPVGR
jgi:hypothetical protein